MSQWQTRRLRFSQQAEHGLFLRRLEARNPLGTLVYIHGLGESGLCFERLITDERLERWSHLVPDLPGYGKSSWTAEPYSLEQHAARIEELLTASATGPVVVLGHSMGGVIGTLLAVRAPHLVRAFVNVEGNISLSDCGYSSRAASIPSEDEWLSAGFAAMIDELYRDERENSEVLRPYCASIQFCDPRAFYRNSCELVEASDAETLAERMATVDRPKVYLFGAPGGTGDRSRSLLSEAGIEMVGIPHAGHWPFLDQPDDFANELLGFLDRLGSDG